MSKKTLALLIVLFAGVFFRDDLTGLYQRLVKTLPDLSEVTADLQDIKRQVNAPAPLRSSANDPGAFLTINGVLKYTNQRRSGRGLAALTMNQRLNAAASAKAQDMFAKQYFAHVGPDGKSAEDWAKAMGYEYIVIGENLALGNFKNDEALVQAWMDSPGHRENILKSSYQEIGIGVKQGTFEGNTVWLAVQIFGKPLNACPAVDQALKGKIQVNQTELARQRLIVDQKKTELEDAHPKRGPEYEQKVEEYNQLVERYNALVGQTKTLAEEYNRQVAAFNSCAGQ